MYRKLHCIKEDMPAINWQKFWRHNWHYTFINERCEKGDEAATFTLIAGCLLISQGLVAICFGYRLYKNKV